jgi:hypothetical protein
MRYYANVECSPSKTYVAAHSSKKAASGNATGQPQSVIVIADTEENRKKLGLGES